MKSRHKLRKNKKNKTRKWITPFEVAQNTFTKTGSFAKTRKSIRKQALENARKLFGSV